MIGKQKLLRKHLALGMLGIPSINILVRETCIEP